MEALLAREFGAKDLKGHIQEVQIRTLDRTSATDAAPQEKNLEISWSRGNLQHGAFGTWHWDNTDIDRLYSCVLFFGGAGEGKEARGGEWLFADAIAEPSETTVKGHARGELVTAGLLVATKRSRTFCYSAGAENIHATAPSTSGYHATMQVWWECPGGGPTGGAPTKLPPRPPKFDKGTGRPAWQKDL